MEKMKRATAIFYIFLLLCVVCTSIGADEYKISVDDVLNITVYREDDLSLIVRVGTDGCIPYPLLGNIKAAGLTVPELEKVLTEGLKKYIQTPHVSIFISEYSTVTVNGEVLKPGMYPLKPGLTVLEAISLAGGFTDFAARNSVKIIRSENGTDKNIVVQAENISKKGNKSKDVQLKDRDIIFVPESLF